MSCQDLLGCVAAAQKKLNLLLRLEEQLMADLPAAYMEAYEFMAIAKVRMRIRLSLTCLNIFPRPWNMLSRKGRSFTDRKHKALQVYLVISLSMSIKLNLMIFYMEANRVKFMIKLFEKIYITIMSFIALFSTLLYEKSLK